MEEGIEEALLVVVAEPVALASQTKMVSLKMRIWMQRRRMLMRIWMTVMITVRG